MAAEVAGWRWGEAVDVLRAVVARGGLLAIPTESSYGLAVDPRNRTAVETVYALKGRERGKPLPVVAADVAQLVALGVDLEDRGLRAVAPCWPAPLTVVVAAPRSLAATAGTGSLAVRVPAHRRLRRLLAALGTALTATSANRSGEPPVVDPARLGPLLAGYDAVVVDDGVLPGGAPSTVVAWDGEGLRPLRRGAFPMAALPAGIETAVVEGR